MEIERGIDKLLPLTQKRPVKLLEQTKFYHILWYDTCAFNTENSKYYSKYHNKERILITRVDNVSDAILFLENSTENYIVIVPGATGENLLKVVKDLKNVLGMVIFPGDKKKHEWIKNYPHVISVIEKSFNDALKHAKSHHIKYSSLTSLKFLHNDPFNKKWQEYQQSVFDLTACDILPIQSQYITEKLDLRFKAIYNYYINGPKISSEEASNHLTKFYKFKFP